jgi:hypothetical protein
MGEDQVQRTEASEAPAAAEPQWHIAIGKEVYGPATRSELVQWAAEGRLLPGAQALPVGGEHWVPVHLAPELEDLPLTAPPRPAPATYAAYPASRGPVPARRLCDCPHCAGPVTNVAPAYGWPWGFFQRSLRPRFRCGQCGREIAYEQLSGEAQARVTRGVRTGALGWFGLVIGLILFIALCCFAALAAVR